MSIEVKADPQLRALVNQAGKDDGQTFSQTGWWHSIELANGVVTPGVRPLSDLQARYAGFNLPADLTGKRVLDIGCWDGFYSFEAERRGAEVVAVDCWRPEKFFEARHLLGSRVEFHELSVYEVTRARLGAFDIVLFLGVLYHLQHPLLALQRVCEVCSDTAVIESRTIDSFLSAPTPVLEFYEMDELGGQYDNWWAPNTECLGKMARAAGFVRTEVVQRDEASAALKAYRKFDNLHAPATAEIKILDVTNAITFARHYPRRGRQAFLALWVKGLPADTAREEVCVLVGDYGARPYFVGPVNNPAKTEPELQINIPVPPGLCVGSARVQVFCRDRVSGLFEIELSEGSEW